jgi:hypothetical protein
MTENEDINSRAYRLAKAMRENDLHIEDPPVPNSRDSTGPIPNHTTQLNVNNKASTVRFVSDRLLWAIRHNVVQKWFYCHTHRELLAQFMDSAQGVHTMRDCHGFMHGLPWDPSCRVQAVDNSLIMSYVDGETDGKLSEFMETILRLKENLDIHLRNNAIEETKRKARIQELRA